MGKSRTRRAGSTELELEDAFPDVEDERATAEEDRVLGDAVELDDPSFLDATWNVYRLGDDGRPLPGPSIGRFVTKLTGALDQAELAKRLGGGCFRLVARLPDRTRRMQVVSIEAPVLQPPPAPAPTVTSSPVPDYVQELRRELAELKGKLTNPPAPARDPIEIFVQALTLARTMVPQQPPASETAVKAMLDMWERGRKSGMGAEPSTLDTVKEMLPAILQLFPKPAPAALPSPAPAPAAPAPLAGVQLEQLGGADRRVVMLTEILANAIAHEQDVEDLVAIVEGILSEAELTDLERATPELLLERIGPGLRALYPVLESAAALPYLGRLLETLRQEPGEAEAS